MVISLFSNWMLVMATKVGPSAPGFEAWAAVDHQDYRAINWSNHNLTSTQSNRRVWIMPWLYIFYIHGVDCKRSESNLFVCSLFIISFEDMFNASDNDKKIKVCVTQV